MLIFLAAALFRLTNLRLIEFKADEAINLFLASRPLFGHPFPPGSTVSSIGILNPPLFNYLLLPFLHLSLDPKFISFIIALINTLTIVFLFYTLKRLFSQQTACLTCLLMAFSPWAILFSRKIWSQNLLVPLVILVFFFAAQILQRRHQNYWLPYIIGSLFLIQLHQAAILFLGLFNLFFFWQLHQAKIKPNWKKIIFGLTLGIIPLFPYLNYVAKNIFSHPEVILVPKTRFTAVFQPEIFLRLLQIPNQGNFHFILGQDTLTFAALFPFIYQLRQVFYLEYLLIPLGMWLFWRKQSQWRFLIYSVILLPLTYFFLHFEPQIHYYLLVLPFLFLFLATTLTALIKAKPLFLRLIGFSLVCLLLISSISFDWAFSQLLERQGGLKGDYGQTYARSEAEITSRLSPYLNDPAYREMFLANFLPTQYWLGNLPYPRLVYDFKQTERQMEEMENRLRLVPVDARLQMELLAFYTQTPPTPERLNLLLEKSRTLPVYKSIYETSLKLYSQTPNSH